MIDMLRFIFFCGFFIILPIYILDRKTRFINSSDPLIRIFIYLSSGFLFELFLSLIVRTLHLPFFFLWIIPISSLLLLGKSLQSFPKKSKFTISRSSIFALLVICLMVALQSLKLWPGGAKVDGNLRIVDFHDSLWNIAITQELIDTFPPQNFAFSGFLFKNNHFFYQLFLASFSVITGADVIITYYKIAPAFASFLFGLGLYATVQIFVKREMTVLLGIFFGYFTGSLAYVLPLIFKQEYYWRNNTFLADQPFDQIGNPYTVLGFAIFLFALYSLTRICSRDHPIWYFLGALAGGLLYGIKAYGGVIYICSLALIALYHFFFRRETSVLRLFIFTLPIFIFTFFTISELGKTTLNWQPGWLLSEMMVGQDKLNIPNWVLKEEYYRQTKNNLGLLMLKGKELALYLFGNLNIRILGLGVFVLWGKEKKHPEPVLVLFLLFSIAGGLLIPLFFNQGANAYNVIQFTPYSLVILSILSMVVIEKFVVFVSRRFGRGVAVGLIVLLVGVAIPTNVREALSYLAMDFRTSQISSEEMKGLDYLRMKAKRDAIVLVHSDRRLFIYIPALIQRRLYLLHPGLARQTGIDPSKREAEIRSLFDPEDRSEILNPSFLEREHIEFIYLTSQYPREIINKIKGQGYEQIFSNEQVVLYGKNI